MQNPVLPVERHLNAQTMGLWEAYASHRDHVMRAIDSAVRALPNGTGCRSLCILGAGNLNDVELPRLTQVFKRITLIDLDRAALTTAVERQLGTGCQESAQITVLAPVDLSGVAESVFLRRSLPGSLPAIATRLAQRPSTILTDRPDLVGRFDVVVSPCVVSQLMAQVTQAFPAEVPVQRELARVVRDAHIRLMLWMLTAGGVGVLVSDIAEASNAPSDFARIRDEATGLDLDREVQMLESEGKHYPWLAPRELKEHVLDRRYAALKLRARTTEAWLWSFGKKRYLCSALQVQRMDYQPGPIRTTSAP